MTPSSILETCPCAYDLNAVEGSMAHPWPAVRNATGGSARLLLANQSDVIDV